MKIPVIQGIIKRRLLLNYRIDPEVAAKQLPAPFRPRTFGGFAIAGICLIRLEDIRPRFVPGILGISSENAAHRFAVEWERGETKPEGVYIPKRHTGSKLNSFLGGRFFPGVHESASFEIEESAEGHIDLSITDRTGTALVKVISKEAADFPSSSIFTLDESSQFFENGSLGYSPAAGSSNTAEGLRLDTEKWEVSPLAVEAIESSYFDDQTRFPAGSIAFDHALLMRDVPHCWVCEETITTE